MDAANGGCAECVSRDGGARSAEETRDAARRRPRGACLQGSRAQAWRIPGRSPVSRAPGVPGVQRVLCLRSLVANRRNCADTDGVFTSDSHWPMARAPCFLVRSFPSRTVAPSPESMRSWALSLACVRCAHVDALVSPTTCARRRSDCRRTRNPDNVWQLYGAGAPQARRAPLVRWSVAQRSGIVPAASVRTHCCDPALSKGRSMREAVRARSRRIPVSRKVIGSASGKEPALELTRISAELARKRSLTPASNVCGVPDSVTGRQTCFATSAARTLVGVW